MRDSLKKETENNKKKPRKRVQRTDEEKEEEAAFENMSRVVKEMKSISKSTDMDPLTESIAGVLSLYQGNQNYSNEF